MSETILAPSSGSWPLHPPQTMRASRMIELLSIDSRGVSVEFADPQADGQRGRALRPARHGDEGPGFGRPLERLHHFKYVKGKGATGAMGPIRPDRMGHVGCADDAIIAVGIGMFGFDPRPGFLGGHDFDLSVEEIGVGHDERTLRAVNFERSMLVAGDVEAHRNRNRRSADELHRASDMGRRVDGNSLAAPRLAANAALVAPFWCHA